MSKQIKAEYNVTVLSREDVTTYPKLNQPMITVIVTYIAAGLPPHSINIPKKEWNIETEKKLIKADIEKRLKAVPETYKV